MDKLVSPPLFAGGVLYIK